LKAGPEDAVAPGQFLTSGLLTDRQRARQDQYQKLFAEPVPRSLANRQLLLAWAEPVDLHFRLVPGAEATGSALLMVPFRFERTPPETPVTIPAALVEARRVSPDGRVLLPPVEARDPARVRLRFRVPESVLPLSIERARLSLGLSAPLREVVLRARVSGDLVELRRWTGPQGTEQLEIDDPRLLRLDDHGAFHVELSFSELRGRTVGQDAWRMESAALEVRGKTSGKEQHETR
jgi:hypothetical protein